MRAPRRFWALGLTPRWVQIRSGGKSPTAHVRFLMDNTIYVRTWPANEWGYRDTERKHKVNLVRFSGGRILGTVLARTFMRLTKKHVGMGKVLEISAAQAERLGLEKPKSAKGGEGV